MSKQYRQWNTLLISYLNQTIAKQLQEGTRQQMLKEARAKALKTLQVSNIEEFSQKLLDKQK